MKVKQAKQTAKAKKALEVIGGLYNIQPEFMRKDREAVLYCYAELEARGYRWIAAKQEWALIQQADIREDENTITYMIAFSGESVENATYILMEGLAAAGYVVTHQCVLGNVFAPGDQVIHLEVLK